MTDAYGFSGFRRYAVPMKRGNEHKSIEICADRFDEAERKAIFVANSDDIYLDWNEDCDEDAELDGLVEILDEEDRPEWTRRFGSCGGEEGL